MKLFKKRESILTRYAKAEFEALRRQGEILPPEERALVLDFADEITGFLKKLERAGALYDVPPELSNRVQVIQSLGALK